MKEENGIKIYDLLIPEVATGFNRMLFWELENNLGEVTDVEIIYHPEEKHLKYQVKYRSNGIEKSDYYGDLKIMIACCHYVNQLIQPPSRK